jgi:hypothetical protein
MGEVDGRRTHQVHQRTLGGVVGPHTRIPAEPGDRGRHHHGAGLRPDQSRDGGPQPEHAAAQVHVEHAVEVFERQRLQTAGARRAGVQHQDVEAAELLARRLDRGGIVRLGGHVAHPGRDTLAGVRPGQGVRVRIQRQHPDTRSREQLAGGAPDSTGRTGHDCYASFV